MKQELSWDYEEIPIDHLTASDLLEQARQASAKGKGVAAYSITIDITDADLADKAEAIFFPDNHRLGIVWGEGPAFWVLVADLEDGIDMYIQNGEDMEGGPP